MVVGGGKMHWLIFDVWAFFEAAKVSKGYLKL